MKDSEATHLAQDRVERLAALVDGNYLREEIDSRIDRVVDTLRFDLPDRPTVAAVHQALSVLVQAVYTSGLKSPVRLSPAQALAEALDLLEYEYRTFGQQGYLVALVEAITSEHVGLAQLLSRVVQIIKSRERQKHIRWATFSCLGTLEWEVRLKVSSLLGDRITSWFPQAAGLWPPVLPTEAQARVILSELEADHRLRAILGNDLVFSSQ